MVQGVNKEYIFYKDEYIEKYLEIIQKNKDKYNLTIMLYCVMNNHAHFLVYVEDIKELGRFMQKNNLHYAQFYNNVEKRYGVLFRNRYQAEPIYDTKYLINCIKYIHDNPVKAKMVSDCKYYKYSSYNDYINNTGITQSEIMISLFGKECNYINLFQQEADKRFLDVREENEITNEYAIDGISYFMKKNCVKLVDLLSNRKKFKSLISFLNKECGLKYIEIQMYFDIPRGIMEGLKK